MDDIYLTSNPIVLPERSMTSSTFSTKKLDPTRATNVPCPPLCGAIFSRTGELVTFNNGQVRKIWSFQQINEGGFCNVQKKFPKTTSDLTEMNRSLQTLKLEHALETNGSSCATSSNSNEEGGSTNCSSSSCIINKTKRDTPTTNDYSCAKDDSSLISGNNKEDGSTSGDDTSSDDESISIFNSSSSSSSSSSSNNSDSSSDESISYYKSKCRFIIATAQSWRACGTSSVHEPDEAVLLKCLKADIAHFKKEYGSWKLSKWKERMKKFITIPFWTGAYDYQYTREFEESKQNIIHHTRAGATIVDVWHCITGSITK